jgi:hypothetical protein
MPCAREKYHTRTQTNTYLRALSSGELLESRRERTLHKEHNQDEKHGQLDTSQQTRLSKERRHWTEA